jgi:hypothetical protein
MNSKKIGIVILILISGQVISAIVCWLFFKEFYVVPTFIGSLFPALMYLRQNKE